jgi:hypothetical protein
MHLYHVLFFDPRPLINSFAICGFAHHLYCIFCTQVLQGLSLPLLFNKLNVEEKKFRKVSGIGNSDWLDKCSFNLYGYKLC